jgi:hypothetical protein
VNLCNPQEPAKVCTLYGDINLSVNIALKFTDFTTVNLSLHGMYQRRKSMEGIDVLIGSVVTSVRLSEFRFHIATSLHQGICITFHDSSPFL